MKEQDIDLDAEIARLKRQIHVLEIIKGDQMKVTGNFTVVPDKKFMAALDAFEKSQGKKTRAVDVCATYAMVRPILAGILPFISFIPSIGPRIAAAIKALMAGLDAYCAAPGR